MNGWTNKSFKECVNKVKNTRKIKRKLYLEKGKYPIVSQEDKLINGYWNEEEDLFKIDSPLVIFGDHTRCIKYIDFNFVIGADGVKILEPKDFLLPKFLYYQLLNANIKKIGYARHFKLLNELNITYPSLIEQQRIVAILDEAFEGIKKARENAGKNLQNARDLFEGYLENIYKKSCLEGNNKKLSEICEIKPSKQEAKNLLMPDDLVSFVPMENLGMGEKHFEPKHVKPLSSVIGNYTYFANGDVLLAKITPCFENGKLGIAKDLYNGIGFGSSEFFVLRTKECLDREYLYYSLSRKTFRSEGKSHMGGAVGHQRIPKEFVENYVLPVPSIANQKQAVRELDGLYMKAKHLESNYTKKTAALDELKKSLLDQAFTGKL